MTDAAKVQEAVHALGRAIGPAYVQALIGAPLEAPCDVALGYLRRLGKLVLDARWVASQEPHQWEWMAGRVLEAEAQLPLHVWAFAENGRPLAVALDGLKMTLMRRGNR